MRAVRAILWVIGGFAALAVVLFVIVVFLVRRPFPDVRGVREVEGVERSVEILRDEDGVAHVYASSIEDVYFGQGYAHAQDRFWQMEFWRRIGSGRLSEVLGEGALDQDRYLRTMGFARVAAEEYDLMPAAQRRILDAYASGVNAYILNRKPARLGLEFFLLGLTGTDVGIEPWTGVNTLTWGKVMALDLGLNMNYELSNISLLRFGGTQLFETIRAPYPDHMPYIVSLDEVLRFRAEQGLPPLEAGQTIASYASGRSGVGSNNWVIGPTRTSTGAPILANDMHLGVQIPSIWYEVGLHVEPVSGAAMNVRGFSFPGVPGVIAGQNETVAWGMTNLGGDVQDLFLERVNPDDPDEYWDGSSWQPMVVIREPIYVDGQEEPVIQRVRITPRGPILSDLPQMERWSTFAGGEAYFPSGYGISEVSLRWSALEPETLLSAVLGMAHATDAYEFREVMRHWASPSQNLVFADNQGNIGYQSTGSFPDRHPAGGRAPGSGWVAEDPGRVEFDDYPAVMNPERDYIVTANNPVIEPGYPYPLGLDYSNGMRARRITDLIVYAARPIDFDYVASIHADVSSMPAGELMPLLSRITANDAVTAYDTHRKSIGVRDLDEGLNNDDFEFLESALTVLRSWDMSMSAESAGAAAYGYIWKSLMEATFKDEAPDHAWPLTSVSTFETVFLELTNQPAHELWDDRDTPRVEEMRHILARAVVFGLLEARDALGDKPEEWSWGDAHTIEFRNATLGESGIGPIERLFNRGPFPVAGGASTVNVSHWSPGNPFVATTIVSQRAIYDLSNPSNSRFTHPTGQSGHPFHRHYMSLFDEWSEVEYHPARWTREEVEASAGRRRLVLEPAE